MRVFQQFATLDLLSGGRAEIMAGRGSFIESFPLFGYDLEDYDELFAEKLDLLARAVRDASGSPGRAVPRRRWTTSGVYPRPVQDPLPVWVAVGGNPQSVVRAGVLGLPLALAIIGGEPERFAPLVDLYRARQPRAARRRQAAGRRSTRTASSPTPRRRRREPSTPPYAAMMTRIGRERGWSPMTREQFDALRSGRAAHSRSAARRRSSRRSCSSTSCSGTSASSCRSASGTAPHAEVMRSIELLGTEVAPIVREEVARRGSASA